MKPVCLVIGGAGVEAMSLKFASDGYHSCLCRRSDEEGLAKLVGEMRPMVERRRVSF